MPFGPHDFQVDTLEQLMFGPDCDRTRGGLVSPYDEPLYEHIAALNARDHLVVRPQGDWRFDYRHVPQHLPDEWAAGHFTGVLDSHPRHLHITAAIRLVKMTSGGSEITADESLGIPRGTARPCVHHVRV